VEPKHQQMYKKNYEWS